MQTDLTLAGGYFGQDGVGVFHGVHDRDIEDRFHTLRHGLFSFFYGCTCRTISASTRSKPSSAARFMAAMAKLLMASG